MITEQNLKESINYTQYRQLVEKLLAEGKTTGHTQSQEYLNYAKVNQQRMNRLDKTIVINSDLQHELARIATDYIWLVITEGWCGDAAQNVPVFAAIEKICPRIQLRLLLRDDHPEVMDQYLTKGARSIPKLICLKKQNLAEVFTWGPRPAVLQEKVSALLKGGASKEEKGLMVQQWYNNDKTTTIQQELLELITTCCVKHSSL